MTADRGTEKGALCLGGRWLGGGWRVEQSRASGGKAHEKLWVHRSLSDRLLQQLDDPLTVVSGALPAWCRLLPMLCPMMFTKQARLRLVRTNGFGISRAVLKVISVPAPTGITLKIIKSSRPEYARPSRSQPAI